VRFANLRLFSKLASVQVLRCIV